MPRPIEPDAVDAAIQLLLTHARDNSEGRIRFPDIVRYRFGAEKLLTGELRIYIDVDGATLDE